MTAMVLAPPLAALATGSGEEQAKAILNILEDFAEEKSRLEEAQRAMLNILEDFNVERARTEAANRELSANEESLRQALHEKENLLREIHHRVKNNLQVIHSMLNLQLSYLEDERAIELIKESKNRVYSMALIHERLYQSESLVKIDLPAYVRGLVANLFLSYGVSERVVVPSIRVEAIALDADALIPVALIFTELISNSLKHAFTSPGDRQGGPGEIGIELRRGPQGQVLLTVSDNGRGLPAGFDIRHSASLGLKLVGVLVKQLNGTLHCDSGQVGTRWEIAFSRAQPAQEGREHA